MKLFDQSAIAAVTRNQRHVRRDQAIQGKRGDRSIGINHEQVLVKGRVDTDNVLDLVVDLQLEGVHRGIEVHLRHHVSL